MPPTLIRREDAHRGSIRRECSSGQLVSSPPSPFGRRTFEGVGAFHLLHRFSNTTVPSLVMRAVRVMPLREMWLVVATSRSPITGAFVTRILVSPATLAPSGRAWV